MYKKTFLSASIVLALASTAHAEEYALFDEVVVSATRTNQQLEDVAASVAVISDEEIERNLTTGVEDLFKYTPGVTVQSNSRQGIQGINIRGMEGNRVLVLVDGVAQTNQFSPSGGQSYNFINSSRVDLDTDMLKSVEVVKGSASSLYGSDAIGGIVAFETKDPEDFLKGRDTGGHVKFNYSSADNTFSESVALAKRFGDLEALVAYTRRDGEQVDNFGKPDEKDFANNNVLVKLQYQLNPDHRLEFSGNFLHNSGDTKLTNSSYTNYNGEDVTKQTQIGIKHIWNAESQFADLVTWQFDWLDKDENGITNRTSKGGSRYVPPAGNVQKKDYIYSDKGYQFDAQFDKEFTLGEFEHYLVYGTSFSDKEIKNVNNEYNSISADKVIYYIPSAKERKYGFFLQDSINYGKFVLTPGVRFDSFETDPGDTTNNPSGNSPESYGKFSDSAVTGRLGTTYSINNEHKVYAQVSQGFRAPDFQELYYSFGNPTHGYINIPNPDLKAEESVSYELGWRHNTDFSSTEVSVFYSDYDNFIDSQVVRVDGRVEVNQSINVDKAEIKGFEVGNTFYWDNILQHEGFSTRLAGVYTEGKDGKGKALNSVNPWNAIVGFNYDAPNEKWGSSLSINYTAAKKDKDISTSGTTTSGKALPIGSATVVDLTAYYSPIKDLTLRAGLFNVTDEEYYNWNDVRGITSEEDKSLTQPGRNWAITAKYDF
ncbi:TonB-dependent hemoglobin/transferrin/lactoferrin family receptor [Vibrio tubiashii]|uniref:TonB-dependent heme and hemoglobin receptor HutA n=1 Tax=Vibrio tubiashii ATCC 19109 TaxID=1051646 RepID=F9SZU0_9VIBR|nr:TonB-dependent hemoglobin/transferrin/lactoferrin family receptor [Vibrio tubiashii]AIW16327.1 TonB-dependent receptor [Vibrio tubiashii ATCC 19109]EGU59018.1 TonB-dependent heme and hemoglobin receptor HutA [Vibrio tubiashii ATCC 19109]EIF02186.1 TonB-dependent heme and hemoglobin receptor HutA [Vibrio tubiashii NCIMB 1337 = ATCC 19106]